MNSEALLLLPRQPYTGSNQPSFAALALRLGTQDFCSVMHPLQEQALEAASMMVHTARRLEGPSMMVHMVHTVQQMALMQVHQMVLGASMMRMPVHLVQAGALCHKSLCTVHLCKNHRCWAATTWNDMARNHSQSFKLVIASRHLEQRCNHRQSRLA